MTRNEWLGAFAAELGVAVPDDATIERLLDLAGAAAHASERTAAPIACYLVGLAGADIATASAAAESVAPAGGG